MTSVVDDSCAKKLAAAETLLNSRNVDEALTALRDAEASGADRGRCVAGRWLAHMLNGDFTAAWDESHTIRADSRMDPNCLWRGEAISGRKVLVRCLHGYGDAVQFFRYAARLKAAAAEVIWEVSPDMLAIARCFHDVERVIAWGEAAKASLDWDVQLEIMELPCVFRTRLDELPIATSYLRLPQKLTSSVSTRMGRRSAPRIGVAWAAGEWNRARSIPVEMLGAIFETSGCEFWNLQGGADRRFLSEPHRSLLCDAEPCNSGILPLAAVISNLDLVITVDTLAAHLAGALGVPAWVILQYAADWRWMLKRSDSPWYPSLRLFRQPSHGDWAGALKKIKNALSRWMESQPEGIAA